MKAIKHHLKKIFFCSLLSWITAASFAQAPQMLNYQAVVRNSSGQTVANNTSVRLRFTIHNASPTGVSVFTEIINTTANQFGLVNVQIGSVSNLSSVNWGNGAKYLQVETDVNNSGTFTDMGTSQLISVPYALYAQSGNPGPAGPTGATGAQGAAGNNGASGITGAKGDTGAQGMAGATGATGNDGQNGLNGNTGHTGAQGNAGATGATGAGVTGPIGPSGNDGQNGLNGNTGATGPTGNDGIAGTSGATGATGPTGPAGNGGSWQLVDFSDFQNDDNNWTVTSGAMTRGTFANVGTATGNYIYYMTGNSTTAITKTFDLSAYPHSYVMVKFTYWFIDSWDANNDRGQVSISSDDVTYNSIWVKYGWTSLGTANLIQQTGSAYNDYYVKEDAIAPHSGNTLYVRFNALGIGNNNDESFGVDDIEVYVR